MTEPVIIKIDHGLCELKFSPGYSTGPSGSDTSPGIGFDIESEFVMERVGFGWSGRSGHFTISGSVIGRAKALELRNMLEIFLKKCAQNELSRSGNEAS